MIKEIDTIRHDKIDEEVRNSLQPPKYGNQLFVSFNLNVDQSSNMQSKRASFQSSAQEKQEIQYDPFKIPPDLGQCYFHRIASQFGKPIEFNFHQSKIIEDDTIVDQHLHKSRSKKKKKKKVRLLLTKKLCPCCGQEPKQQFPIFCRNQEIYKVNESLGFYFTYTKTMCLMLFLMTVIVGIYAFKYVLNDCQESGQCYIIYGLPVSQFRVFYNYLLMILNSIIIIIMYIFTGYLYYINAHHQKRIFLNHKKPSDFSLLLTGVDHQKVTGLQIMEYFKDYEIEQILYTHKIQSYIEKLQQKSILTAKRNLFLRKKQTQKTKDIEKELDQVQEYLSSIRQKFNVQHEKQLRTDKVLIKFKTFQQKMKFQSKYHQSLFNNIKTLIRGQNLIEINGNKMQIQILGQPHEIVWQNFQVTTKQRYLRIFISNGLSILIICFSYVVISIFCKLSEDVDDSKDILISLGFGILIQVASTLLNVLIGKLTDYEKRKTLTGKSRVVIIKSFIQIFICTTLIPFSFFVFDWGDDSDQDVIRNIFTIFLLSNFILPFLSIYVTPSFDILFKRNKIIKQGKDCIETQIKANEYFEKHDFDLQSRYSVVLQMLTNSIFYAAVFPVGLVLSLIGLGIAYWISKLWLIKYCSIPKYSHRLGVLVNDITATFPCIFSFGYAFNLLEVHQETQFDRLLPVTIAILTIPITIFFLLYGNKLAEKFVRSQYVALENLYNSDQVNNNVGHHVRKVADYRDLNPTTFINSNIQSQIKQAQFQNILNHLDQYALIKKSSRLIRDNARDLQTLSSRTIRSSKSIKYV